LVQPGLTAGEWLDAWLVTKRRTKRESTCRGYEMHVRTWLKPQLGDWPLDRLNAGHIEELFTTIGRINSEVTAQRAAGVAPMDVKIEGDLRGQSRECGPTTQLRIYATLRAALNAAVKQRKIPGIRATASSWSSQRRLSGSGGPPPRRCSSSTPPPTTRWA
jgi:hypothetical protein